MRPSKLTAQQRESLIVEMQERWALLRQLSPLNLKRIASRYGVPYHVIWRIDRIKRKTFANQ